MYLNISCCKLHFFDFGFQVRNGWLKDPATNGEVVISELSVGEHYFSCSVGDHCLKGMRLRVIVEESGQRQDSPQDSEVSLMHNALKRVWSR